MLKPFTLQRLLLSLLFLATQHWAGAQNEDLDSLMRHYLSEDSVLLDELELMLAEDSITIFDLIDSISNMDYKLSQLSIRLGYTSNITNAGRIFGIEQHGLGAGLGYYHHTGLFADISGYWNSDITPRYNPTVTAVGYMGAITPSWNYSLGYDHYFYRTGDSGNEFEISYPLTNALNASTYLDIGKFTTGIDYSYLFGKAAAHRVRGNIMYGIRGAKLWFIDRITFMPGASVMLGSQDIYNSYPTFLYSQREAIDIIARKVGKRNLLWLYRNNREAFDALLNEFVNNNMFWQEDKKNVFGLMNYSISAPVYLYVHRFSLLLYYNLNIPVALPGEELDLDFSSYFGCTLMYDIPFLSK